MLKLTRRLYAAEPQASYFDYYERAHLNHILAHQRGGERDRLFHIEVDGLRIATQRLHGQHPGEFIERDYALPLGRDRGRKTVRIRFKPETGHAAGPVFGCRVLADEIGS